MEEVYRLALTAVPQIGDVQARLLIEKLGSATAIFQCKEQLLEKIEGIGTVRARAIRSYRNFIDCEKELAFIRKNEIKALFLTDDAYPKKLLSCLDAPVLLYLKGDIDLNKFRAVGIVGTRINSEYGKAFTEKFIQDLSNEGVVIVSGLATGIDSIAHKASVRNDIPTLAVVGHGLDKIYPYHNKDLATEIVSCGGGILSEFTSGTKPDRHNFPLRNRIVAGLCEALVVVETAVKGGSMITAKLADSYNRDVFALPGRVTDIRSSGCNYLIQNNKAILITSADDFREVMGWKARQRPAVQQVSLFAELSEGERKIAALLEGSDSLHIDEVIGKSGLPSSAIAAAILNLELAGHIICLPGKRYRLS